SQGAPLRTAEPLDLPAIDSRGPPSLDYCPASRSAGTLIVVQTIDCERSIFQRNPILSEMSIAYDDLASTGTPLSIFPLANDYLMSGQRMRDKQDVRDRRDSLR